jgi:hypothetical protein
MRRVKLQSEESVLRGVMVCELGEAEGHDFAIDEKFLDAVVEKGNAEADGVKCRLNHPEGRGNVLSIFGRALNFRRDVNGVRADVELFDIPEKSRIVTLAKQAANLCGMSLDFAGETVKKAGSKLKTMTCEAIYGLDLVDTPAATRALFSAGENTNQWRVVCRLSLPAVDSAKQIEDNMATKPELKKTKLEDAPPPADVEQPHAEPDGDEGYEKIMTALAGIEQRLTKLESGGKEKEEELAEEPPIKDEEREEEMATMAAKVCSIMLAKVGIKPIRSAPRSEDSIADQTQLSVDDAKIADTLKMDEKERKQFAATLARAKQVKL